MARAAKTNAEGWRGLAWLHMLERQKQISAKQDVFCMGTWAVIL